MLWPAPGVVTTGRSGDHRSRLGRRVDFVAVPSLARPKLVLPRRPRRATAGAIRRFKTTQSRRTRAAATALAAAARVGLVDVLPGRFSIGYGAGEAASGIDAHLSDVLGRPVTVALYISPARAVRKPLLLVMDERGHTFAFAKLGVTEFTRALVRHEARTVRRLNEQQHRYLQVPRVLHSGPWGAHELLVQSALPGGAMPRSGTPVFREALQELSAVGDVSVGPLSSAPYWSGLQSRLDALPSSQWRTLLDRLRQSIGPDTERPYRFGSSHGDWSPWNTTESDGRILAWDWEKFEDGVPVGMDAVHFDIQNAVVFGGGSPADAFADALRRAPQIVVADDERQARATVLIYALHIGLRYVEDSEVDAGEGKMSRLGTWLPGLVLAAETGSWQRTG